MPGEPKFTEEVRVALRKHLSSLPTLMIYKTFLLFLEKHVFFSALTANDVETVQYAVSLMDLQGDVRKYNYANCDMYCRY